MKTSDLKVLSTQIKRYGLQKAFNSMKEFDEWVQRLSTKQIAHFGSLHIDPQKIMFPIELLMNEDLLNCDDYNDRVQAMLKLKNGVGCWHLFSNLCSPYFLNSKTYYEDMQMISQADTARYALWIINDPNFINSKYHHEDLEWIIKAHDQVVASSLANVAANIDSINSPYHQQDMQLIAQVKSTCLQLPRTYPMYGLNYLAMNKVSLEDEYHLENMKILATKPVAKKFLYDLMTDPNTINNKDAKYYREEIDALSSAKSKLSAIAINNFITNPEDFNYNNIEESLYRYGFTIFDIILINRSNSIKGNKNPKYLEYLKLLNKIDDQFVIYFEILMSDKDLLNSGYQSDDLDLLFTITDKDIFMSLYCLMKDKVSLFGNYHMQDVKRISQTTNIKTRDLLLKTATNKRSVNSMHHEYDMEYISKLDLDDKDASCFDSLQYLLVQNDLNDMEYLDALKELYKNQTIQHTDATKNYIKTIEEQVSSNEKVENKSLSKNKRRF